MRYFRETLESVYAQTLLPDEVLINDDGSSDGTVEFALRFAREFALRNRRRPILRAFRRSGQRQAASRNYAAEQARGQWIAFLDHDDLWLPNKLERQMAELARHPEAEVCYTGRHEWVEDPNCPGQFRLGNFWPVPPSDELQRALFVNTTFMPGSVVMRRSTYLAHGGFDPAYRYVEDWEFWLRLLHAGVRFAAVPEPLLRMRIHSSNQSRHAHEALAEGKEIFRRLVLPHLPSATRWVAHQRSQSGQEAAASYVLRSTGDPAHLRLMATSIARYPFDDPHRYKVLAHMVYTRLRSLAPAVPATASFTPDPSPASAANIVPFRQGAGAESNQTAA